MRQLVGLLELQPSANWWGLLDGGNQYGNWYNSWNNCNQGSQTVVPCAGNNPDTILNNCFNNVYSNGCVKSDYQRRQLPDLHFLFRRADLPQFRRQSRNPQ